jgi:hypothetical protein
VREPEQAAQALAREPRARRAVDVSDRRRREIGPDNRQQRAAAVGENYLDASVSAQATAAGIDAQRPPAQRMPDTDDGDLVGQRGEFIGLLLVDPSTSMQAPARCSRARARG